MNKFLDKIGIPHLLFWGYLGVLIFMMGDGVEQGWLSTFLEREEGLSKEHTALIFTVYGITIGVSSWLSGVLSDMLGVRKTMFYGLIIYLIGVAGFVGISLHHSSYPLMLIMYAIKGFGYPLFSYTFLVWIAKKSPANMLGKAVGWFWFVFTGGLSVLGAIYASWATVSIGYMMTLWSAIIWALIGALFALVFMKFDGDRSTETKTSEESKIQELLKGLTIMKREPKIGIAGIIRTINTMTLFAFPVFMPGYMESVGFTETEWLHIWAVAVGGNIIFNLVFGFVGDIIGWRKTVQWCGAFGCTITTLLFFYAPQIYPNNVTFAMICGFLWGMTLAGYVPLSALVPSLVKEEKGAAMSVLNLGAGLSAFVGPGIISLVYAFGGNNTVVIWVFAVLYFATFILSNFISLPEEKLGTPRQLQKMELDKLNNKKQ